MRRPRLGLDGRLLLFSSILLTLPWLGYQYLENMKSFLLNGQIEAQQLAASAVATALHNRSDLFDPSNTPLERLPTENDLYFRPLGVKIQIDGNASDWGSPPESQKQYGPESITYPLDSPITTLLSFNLTLGERKQYLYGLIHVQDQNVVLRHPDYLRLDNSDQVRIEFIGPDGEHRRIVMLTKADGVVSAYDMQPEWKYPTTGEYLSQLRGVWKNHKGGYTVEFRLPKSWMGPSQQLLISVADVNDRRVREIDTIMATLPQKYSGQLNRTIIQSPEIQRIIDGLQRSDAAICVIDRQYRVRAVNNEYPTRGQICGKTDATGTALVKDALSGKPGVSQRPATNDNDTLIVAAHPVEDSKQVIGVVLFEKTSSSILAAQRDTFMQAAGATALVMLILIALLFGFSARLTTRIRKLHDETAHAIDKDGRVIKNSLNSDANSSDDLGYLSRGISALLGKLKRYTEFLESVPRTLRHEILNPVNTISMSLQSLSEDTHDDKSTRIIQGAIRATNQLECIVSSLTEAAHIEDAIKNDEHVTFDLAILLEEYTTNSKQLHLDRIIKYNGPATGVFVRGSDLRIVQLLDKIKDNAIDFSPSGSTILFKLATNDANAIVQIHNDGAIIPDDILESLFIGMTSSRSSSEGNPHLGIGLYIANRIAQHHMGTLTISNTHNPDGVQVVAKLPIDSSDNVINGNLHISNGPQK